MSIEMTSSRTSEHGFIVLLCLALLFVLGYLFYLLRRDSKETGFSMLHILWIRLTRRGFDLGEFHLEDKKSSHNIPKE